MRPIATACLLAGVTLLLYSFRIGAAPLDANESIVLAQARSLSEGESLPLFFQVQDAYWLQPMGVYATAIVGAIGGGDMAGRLASAIVGAVDVALVFAAARMMFGREWLAVVSAVLLLVTPAHWWLARAGTDAIFPAPFVLLWLIGMLRFFRSDSARALAAAGAALGAGVYTHPTAPLVMAWLCATSIAALFVIGRGRARNVAVLAGAFSAMLGPLAIWFVMFPASYGDTFGRWAVFAAHARFPMDGLRAQINWNTLSTRASRFWGLADPSFLFFSATGRSIAPWLASSAVLLPLGIAHVLTSGLREHRLVLLGAFVIPALIASAFGVPQDLGAAVVMTISGALLAGAGLDSLRLRSAWWTWLVSVAAIGSAVQLATLV
jgi:4-amino-4-deoxy-L-arabinose transferase-like glycosyltransferase